MDKLAGDSGHLNDAGVDIGTINNYATSVADALHALTIKAADFSNVGAGTIVENDLDSICSPALTILNNIIRAVAGDCAQASHI